MSPAPEIQTAVALITQRDLRQGPQWQAAVFAALPQEEQVRYLCHVLGQSTLTADEAVHASRLVDIY